MSGFDDFLRERRREAASIMGRKGGRISNAKRTPEERRRFGSMGGRKNGSWKIPPEKRTERAKKAAAARWGKRTAADRVQLKQRVLGVWL